MSDGHATTTSAAKSKPFTTRPDRATHRLFVTCPACGADDSADRLLEDWQLFDADENYAPSYRFKCCGHRAHLNEKTGGAKSRLEPK